MDVLESYFLLCLTELYCLIVSCHEIPSVWRHRSDSGTLCGSTPAGLRNAFLSNCTQLSLNESTCNQAWGAFSRAFAHKDPNNIKNSDYVNYFNLLPIKVQPNQNLFWSGVFELVAVLGCNCSTGADVVSSANTPSSAIIDNIGLVHWCGTLSGTSTDGIDYSNSCPCGVTEAFWAQFSIQFASVASGMVFYLGNGEREGGMFQPDSNFAQYELPRLNPPKVNEVVIIVTHRKKHGESCRDGQTVANLRHRVSDRKLKYSCYDVFGDPKNQSQWKDLSFCTSRIVSAVQQGTVLEPNECFLAETQDETKIPIGPIVGGVLGVIGALAVIVIILFIILFVLRHKYPVKLLLNSRTRNKGFVSTVAYGQLMVESDEDSE